MENILFSRHTLEPHAALYPVTTLFLMPSFYSSSYPHSTRPHTLILLVLIPSFYSSSYPHSVRPDVFAYTSRRFSKTTGHISEDVRTHFLQPLVSPTIHSSIFTCEALSMLVKSSMKAYPISTTAILAGSGTEQVPIVGPGESRVKEANTGFWDDDDNWE